MIKQELLDILACPKCKDKIELSGDGKYLICGKCRLRYPINEQGIPVMLVERAEKLES
jgi:uncharacterized protein YbaR (Trm112 family)